MIGDAKRLLFRLALVALVLATVTPAQLGVAEARNRAASSPKQQDSAQQPAPEMEQVVRNDKRPAEQVYKNIQVLKGMPSDELIETMKYYARSLGVRCEFCHVTAPGSRIPGFGAFSKDDKDEKKTARVMVQMVDGLNKQYFKPGKGPTCWTCHRGSHEPELAPPPPPSAAPAAPAAPAEPPK